MSLTYYFRPSLQSLLDNPSNNAHHHPFNAASPSPSSSSRTPTPGGIGLHRLSTSLTYPDRSPETNHNHTVQSTPPPSYSQSTMTSSSPTSAPVELGDIVQGEASDSTESSAIFFVRSLYDYSGVDTSSLSFRQADIIEVHTCLGSGWWDGIISTTGERGWFPSNYVERISNEEANEELGRDGATTTATVAVTATNAEPAAGAVTAGAEAELTGDDASDDFLMSSITPAPSSSHHPLLAPEGSVAGQSAEDLTSFSSGDNVFGELAAAAASSASASIADDFPTDAHDQNAESSDYWLPRVSDVGEIYYFNTLTNETSRDMPPSLGHDGPSVAPHGSLDRFANDSASTATYGNAAGGTSANGLGLHEREPPSASSTQTEFAGDEWVKKVTDDRTRYYWESRRTGEIRWMAPETARVRSRPTSAIINPNAVASGSGSNNNNNPRSLMPALTEDSPQLPSTSSSLLSSQALIDSASARRPSVQSFQSDAESVIDADLLPSPRKTQYGGNAAARAKGKTSMEGEVARQWARENSFAARMAAIDPGPPPTFHELAGKVRLAADDLIRATTFRTLAATDDEGPAPKSERDRLAALAANLLAEVRAVLSVTGVLEPTPGSTTIPSYGPDILAGRALPLSPQAVAELKPVSKDVITTLSKLVLSARATWGVMGVSPEFDDDDDLDFDGMDEEELQLDRQMRATIREARRENDENLKRELAFGAQKVMHMTASFVQEVQRISGSDGLNNHLATYGLPLRAQKHTTGHFLTSLEVLLGNGGAWGGNWRANGFAPHMANTGSRSRITANPSARPPPSQQLSGDVTSFVVGQGRLVESEVNKFKEMVKTMIDVAAASSASSATDTTAVAAAAARAATRAFPQLLTHTAELLNYLADFLNFLEDVDIAARLDIDAALDLVAAMKARRASGQSFDGIDVSSVAMDAQLAEYYKEIVNAKSHMDNLILAKQALYDLCAALLFRVQSAGMPLNAPVGDDNIADLDGLEGIADPSEPDGASPLAMYTLPGRPADPLKQTQTTLDEVKERVNVVIESLAALTRSADAQATYPTQVKKLAGLLRQAYHPPQWPETEGEGSMNGRDLSGRPLSMASSFTLLSTHDRESRGLDEENDEFGDRMDDPYSNAPFNNSRNTMYSAPTPATSVSAAAPSSFPYNGARRGSVPMSASGSTSSIDKNFSRRDTITEGMDASPVIDNVTSPTRSPSKQKIKKFFGDEAPQSVPRPLAPVKEDSTPTFLDVDWGPDDITFSVEGTVKGGTLQALVAKLTAHKGSDENFKRTFLMTYRTFTNSESLLNLLVQRYQMRPPANLTPEQVQVWNEEKLKLIQIRVVIVMKQWIESFCYQDEDATLLEEIADFATNGTVDVKQGEQIREAIKRRKILGGPKPRAAVNPAGDPPPPILPRSLKKLKFTEIDPLEIARQLTIKDSKLFSSIGILECLAKAWPKQFGSDVSPNIKHVVDRCNAITWWVADSILKQEDLKKRANTIKHFVNVAERCRSLQNYTTLMHIIAGLNSTPIHRLKRTWETVNQRTVQTLSQLSALTSPAKNFAEYREAIRSPAPPLVPFLGVYFTDWLFFGEANADTFKDKPNHINFHKRQKVAELVQQIQTFQSEPYNLKPVPAMQTWLDDHLSLPRDEHQLYQLSLELEPRERDDEKIARLLAESGFL